MSKPPNFTVFSWKVFVSRGPCYKDIMGRFFMRPDFSQIRQTFKIFLEGVSFSGVFVTYIRWRVFFHDPQHRQNCQTLPFFLGGCFVFEGLSYWYIMGGFFVADFPSSLPNFRIYFWKGEILKGGRVTDI